MEISTCFKTVCSTTIKFPCPCLASLSLLFLTLGFQPDFDFYFLCLSSGLLPSLTTPVLWQHLALCLPFPVWKVYFISEILQVPLMIMLSRFSLTLCNSRDCSPPGSSVRGILQARILEWVDVSASRGYSQPRDQICFSFVSCIGRWVLYHLRKPEICWSIKYLGWSLKSCCFFCWSMCGCVILLGYREWPVLKMN